jgi:hypothetical protein
MLSDEQTLRAELAESIDQLRLNGWTIETGWQRKASEAFVHARQAHSRGLDESLVTARFGQNLRLELDRYALPCGKHEWIECDEYSFEGFLEEGAPGLLRSTHEVRRTHCRCGKKIHRSSIRAQAFARRVAQEAGADAFQRFYRCDENARAFHLSSKKNSIPIPGAYVVLKESWNS